MNRRPDPWPWPADTTLERSRTIARGYRAALIEVAPAVARRLDERARVFGESWISAKPIAHDPDELLTPSQAAELAQVAIRTITTWRLERRPPLPAVRTPDGIRIRAGDLTDWLAERRHRRGRNPDRA